jgi:hypothetical protein
MNKLDMFFKEEIDYEDFVQTVEEDASLDFLVEKDSPSTMNDDAVDDPGSEEDKFDIDALISDDEEKETGENDTGYEDEQPVEESTIILF